MKKYYCKKCKKRIYPVHYPEEPEYCIDCADEIIDLYK